MLCSFTVEQLTEVLQDMLIYDAELEELKRKKKYCVAITTKNKRCKNYARIECTEQLCYSHRNLVGTEPDQDENE